MNHKFEEHKNCTRQNCWVCDGGLAICEVCGCLEGSLPTECPGYDCYKTYGEAIYSGDIDFRDGKWINSPSIHSPKGIAEFAALLRKTSL